MIFRRVFATGLAAAGLYVGALAPAGALAQDPTPSADARETATAVSDSAIPESTVAAEETSAPQEAPEETSTPQEAGEEPSSTPQADPEPEETSTPQQDPEPTSTPGGDDHGHQGDGGGDDTSSPQGDDEDPRPTPTPRPSTSPQPVPTVLPTPTPSHGSGSGDAMQSSGPGDAEDEPAVGTASGSDTVSAPTVSTGDFTVDLAGSVKPGKTKPKSPSRTAEGCASTSIAARGCSEVDTIDSLAATKILNSDGTPTDDNPTLSLATVGPAPIGVPNFFIDKFRIPPFLLPIYQAAGIQYGIRWEVLAAINEIETDYGRNLNVSSAGAEGWMQFMPATWRQYGVDANKDGVRDPYNPVDAIFSAARYLKAAGADSDLRRGIFAYNHADWYVDSVLLRARLIGGLPANFVGSLTGLTQARFPVHATARYAGAVSLKAKRVKKGHNASVPVVSDTDRTGIDIFAKRGSPVIAVNDGRIIGLGHSKRLGRYFRLQDVYGNVYTYGHLASVAKTYPAARRKTVSSKQVRRELQLSESAKADPRPERPASTTKSRTSARKSTASARRKAAPSAAATAAAATATPTLGKDRLFANPDRPKARAAGGVLQLAEASYSPEAGAALKLNKRDYVAKRMRKGARIIGGTILGRIGRTVAGTASHVRFEIRPAGRGAPRIDPKPILDGWKLLETTEMYRAAGRNPFVGPDARQLTIGQILLMSKESLQRHVLANPNIDIYKCGRRDVRLGVIDRRVLATLEFLASSGLKPAITSLNCGHGFYTASGNVSEHSTGDAVDIAAINGIVITPATQGPGSITEMTIQRLLTLQGTMKPHQIISLMTFKEADNTYAMGDHDDHIHVGFRPLYATGSKQADRVNSVLKPKQWIKLIERLGEIDNPTVRTTPSKAALKAAGTGD